MTQLIFENFSKVKSLKVMEQVGDAIRKLHSDEVDIIRISDLLSAARRSFKNWDNISISEKYDTIRNYRYQNHIYNFVVMVNMYTLTSAITLINKYPDCCDAVVVVDSGNLRIFNKGKGYQNFVKDELESRRFDVLEQTKPIDDEFSNDIRYIATFNINGRTVHRERRISREYVELQAARFDLEEFNALFSHREPATEALKFEASYCVTTYAGNDNPATIVGNHTTGNKANRSKTRYSGITDADIQNAMLRLKWILKQPEDVQRLFEHPDTKTCPCCNNRTRVSILSEVSTCRHCGATIANPIVKASKMLAYSKVSELSEEDSYFTYSFATRSITDLDSDELDDLEDFSDEIYYDENDKE